MKVKGVEIVVYKPLRAKVYDSECFFGCVSMEVAVANGVSFEDCQFELTRVSGTNEKPDFVMIISGAKWPEHLF